ncbi:MAG: DUF819 family protein [Bacteroidota bacterium]
MELTSPFFTNDAIAFGLLMLCLAFVFFTSSSEQPGWKKFYTYVPALLLCYFLPALLSWPLGLIAPHWYEAGLLDHLAQLGQSLPENGMSYAEVKDWIQKNDIAGTKAFEQHSQLYFVSSRYLLPASLVLLCISIDFKGIINLGPKALIMFFTATLGIVIGGPIALLLIGTIAPDIVGASDAGELWRGLSTIAGSWIGGGANQTAMKEIYEVSDQLFSSMVVIDVVVANIWMGFLLYGANISDKIDGWFKADASAIKDLKERVEDYQAQIARIPSTTDYFIMLGIAFGITALSHWGADVIAPFFDNINEQSKLLIGTNGEPLYPNGKLVEWGISSIMSGFFWLIVISTILGVLLSFTKARQIEGAGASKIGSLFIYILVATIGMKMDIGEVFNHLDAFAIGLVWMLVHVSLLLFVGKLIKAPFFFTAVGSQANVGGAASAPVVAAAFSPALAPVGVLMAVLGYALGTYGAILCATLMQWVS